MSYIGRCHIAEELTVRFIETLLQIHELRFRLPTTTARPEHLVPRY